MSVLELRDILLFGVPIALASASLFALHWYPWNRGVRELERLTAYTIGTSVVVGAPVIAMLTAIALEIEHPLSFWVAHLVVNTTVCGATVKFAYFIDDGLALGLEDDDESK